MVSIIKCYFQHKIWDGGSCYMFTNKPSFNCIADIKGVVQKSSISVTFSDEEKKDKDIPRITKWLQNDKGKPLSKQEALEWKDHFGKEAYFTYDGDSFELINQEQYDGLSSDDQSYLNASIQASV
jgi:uncharacterized membrane-anchored protein